MSNKPTYAAVVSSPPKDTPLTPQHEGEGPSGSSDAPPPCMSSGSPCPLFSLQGWHGLSYWLLVVSDDGHQPKSQPTIPSQNHPSIHQHINNANAAEQGGLIAGEWVPPPPQVAKSRALRRFWGAFFWGWVIWIVIGWVFGSSFEFSPGGDFFLSTEKKEGLNTEYWVTDYILYSQGDYWRRRSRRWKQQTLQTSRPHWCAPRLDGRGDCPRLWSLECSSRFFSCRNYDWGGGDCVCSGPWLRKKLCRSCTQIALFPSRQLRVGNDYLLNIICHVVWF